MAAALPQVAADLGDIHLLPWVITGYLFASGVAAVAAGPLIDLYGTRLLFRGAVSVFTLAGVGASLAPSMPVMIAVRLAHGVGAGLVISVALTAVSLIFPQHLVGRAFAGNSAVWGVMGAAAPAIAALLLASLSWRWIFLVNLPLGAAALLTGWRVMPGAFDPGGVASTGRRRFDPAGLALVAGFTLATLLAVDRLGLASLYWLAGSAIAAVLYRWHATHRSHPILAIDMVARQPYGTLGLGIALMLAAGFAASSYLTIYVSAGRGGTMTAAAWSVFYFTIGWTLGSLASSRLQDRLAETTVILLGLGSTGPGLVLALIAAWLVWPLPVLYLGLMGAGLGVGLSTNAGLTLLRAMTPAEQIGRAISAHQFIRNQGFTIGAALGGAVMLLLVSARLGELESVRRLLAGETITAAAPAAAAVRDGYTATLAVATVLSVAALFPMVQLRRHLAPARAVRRRVP